MISELSLIKSQYKATMINYSIGTYLPNTQAPPFSMRKVIQWCANAIQTKLDKIREFRQFRRISFENSKAQSTRYLAEIRKMNANSFRIEPPLDLLRP